HRNQRRLADEADIDPADGGGDFPQYEEEDHRRGRDDQPVIAPEEGAEDGRRRDADLRGRDHHATSLTIWRLSRSPAMESRRRLRYWTKRSSSSIAAVRGRGRSTSIT